VRRCIWKAHGQALSERFRAPSARKAAYKALSQGLAFPAKQLPKRGGLKQGDILYKTEGSGGFGHVGIYVGNNKVAENASTRHGRVRGALGFRTLQQYGKANVIARIKTT
jgi:cell wall-associated NlpC family hydrolase